MSRIAKQPIVIPSDVSITLIGQMVIVKGSKGELKRLIHDSVLVKSVKSCLVFSSRINSSVKGWAQAGTARSLVNSMIHGVTVGFFKKLKLFGVGYRISINSSKNLNMSLGYSHIIEYVLPFGIFVESISQAEIIVKGINKQLVGQVAANLRAYRKSEPYKGKGIRYSNEIVRVKEAKKK
ncbi:50S ribosomal protein L6 [Buchnera aphidicola str. Bp (Baizongia pistaciae)]|uniref:Large ribosomal subunit protein uL6 n=1 Tax=Buchnera aphidicola subsp. Baizongia pistaciae (strain Bp) TaxID=224915 RepID=RL6_BUCBP|nr:50S ribosomal protein L6 [Buchnera aphidicola]Q89A80.1 RecName: Full=Large ribosomal subunit protein uL6; AltName: Full=50S ribosomal protein L6 [Buchnera aphidicola str. Bp (Baizongia pistaciae)]AAO27158.1 50S ribosomal protein L6 [Buchnera aphidicola str. Bp (Baizongia pistaciae)]